MKLAWTSLCFVLITLPICSTYEEGGNLLFEGEGDDTDLKRLLTNVGKFKSSDIDDDEDSDDLSGDWSGSGDEGSASSGIAPTDIPETTSSEKDKTTPGVVDITLVSKTTDTKNCVDCETEDTLTTTKSPNEVDANTNKNGGVVINDSDNANGYNDKNTKGKTPSKDTDKAGVDFTVGIIIGVVVGAVLAILIIVFLVYRLRKKDEGSYSLDEQSSTAYLRGDTDNPKSGKEYFA